MELSVQAVLMLVFAVLTLASQWGANSWLVRSLKEDIAELKEEIGETRGELRALEQAFNNYKLEVAPVIAPATRRRKAK